MALAEGFVSTPLTAGVGTLGGITHRLPRSNGLKRLRRAASQNGPDLDSHGQPSRTAGSITMATHGIPNGSEVEDVRRT